MTNVEYLSKPDNIINMKTNPGESVLGLKLLEEVHGVIDQGKASGLATTKVGAETKARDNIRSDFVHLGEFLSNLLLGDGCSAWMEDINDLKHHEL